jgi:hypothetical protein
MLNAEEINKRFKRAIAKDPNTLTCIITGRERPTNSEYLEEKAKKVGSKEEFLKHYICRDALTLLKQGMNVADVRKELGVTNVSIAIGSEFLERALEINGK